MKAYPFARTCLLAALAWILIPGIGADGATPYDRCGGAFDIVKSLQSDPSYRLQRLNLGSVPGPFRHDEFVRIDNFGILIESEGEVSAEDGTIETVLVSTEYTGAHFGTFQYLHSDTTAVVNILIAGKYGDFIVPLVNLRPLNPLGTHRMVPIPLSTAEAAVPKPHISSFWPMDPIRYRDNDGKIRHGKFLRMEKLNQSKKIWIIDDQGTEITITPNKLFKDDKKGKGYTPYYDIDLRYYGWESLEIKSSMLRFLNTGARLTSLADFMEASSSDKILSLATFTTAVVRPDISVANQDRINFRNGEGLTFEQTFCRGAGVCRHLTSLFAILSTESGIPATIVLSEIDPETYTGHAWNEVDIEIDGRSEILIVDLANGYTDTYTNALEQAKADPDSLAATYYTAATVQRIVPTLSRPQ